MLLSLCFFIFNGNMETSRDNKYKVLSKRAITNYFNPTQWWLSTIFQILAHIECSPEHILSFNFRSLMFLLALEMAPILAVCSPVILKLRPGPQRFVSGIALTSFAPLCFQFILLQLSSALSSKAWHFLLVGNLMVPSAQKLNFILFSKSCVFLLPHFL